MDMEPRYRDANGKPCNILQMVFMENLWAANRIQEGEKAMQHNAELVGNQEKLADAILAAMIDLREHATDTCWIGEAETVFERLTELYLLAGGERERLLVEFPEYF